MPQAYAEETSLRNFPEPPTLVLSQKYCRYNWEAYCGTNRRRIAVQMGGVLGRDCAGTARHSDIQIGGVLAYFLDKLYGLGAPKQCPNCSLPKDARASIEGRASPAGGGDVSAARLGVRDVQAQLAQAPSLPPLVTGQRALSHIDFVCYWVRGERTWAIAI